MKVAPWEFYKFDDRGNLLTEVDFMGFSKANQFESPPRNE